jgi:hypothetical protein
MLKRNWLRAMGGMALAASFVIGVAPPSTAATAVPPCPWQYEHPATVKTPAAVRSKAISYTRRVEKLGVNAVSLRADVLKAPWWTIGEHRCKWQGHVTMTYGGQLPKGVAVGYRVLVTTSGQMLSGGDALWLTIANVRNTWTVVSAGTSP